MHPEICEGDLIHPPLPLFSFPSFQTLSLGSCDVSAGYFSSPDEFFIARAEMTRGKPNDNFIFSRRSISAGSIRELSDAGNKGRGLLSHIARAETRRMSGSVCELLRETVYRRSKEEKKRNQSCHFFFLAVFAGAAAPVAPEA